MLERISLDLNRAAVRHPGHAPQLRRVCKIALRGARTWHGVGAILRTRSTHPQAPDMSESDSLDRSKRRNGKKNISPSILGRLLLGVYSCAPIVECRYRDLT